MGDTVTRINDGTGQTSVLDLAAGPTRCQRQHSLYSDVQTSAVEGLEHDLGGILARFRGIQRLGDSNLAYLFLINW